MRESFIKSKKCLKLWTIKFFIWGVIEFDSEILILSSHENDKKLLLISYKKIYYSDYFSIFFIKTSRARWRSFFLQNKNFYKEFIFSSNNTLLIFIFWNQYSGWLVKLLFTLANSAWLKFLLLISSKIVNALKVALVSPFIVSSI